MNWLDIVILVILAIAAISGLKVGIIKVLFTMVGVIAGVILAGRFSDSLAGVLTFIDNPGWAKTAAFAIILIAVLVISGALAAILSSLISAVLLGWVNRLGGAILGLVVGAIFCAAILTMWVKFLNPGDALTGSTLARFLLDRFPLVLGLLPSEFDSVRAFFH
jgi:membrane protein required for colicin V production